jgi:hypothetical protein
MSSDMFLTPSNPSSALLSVFWNISAAEEKDILEYYSHIFSANGISTDPKKIITIRNTQIPKDVNYYYYYYKVFL